MAKEKQKSESFKSEQIKQAEKHLLITYRRPQQLPCSDSNQNAYNI